MLGPLRLDSQSPGAVAVDDLGAARGVGGVEIGLGRIRRENSQSAGLGRRIRERQPWRTNRSRERCRTADGHGREGEQHARPREVQWHRVRSWRR